MRSFLDTKKEALELEARRKIYDVVKRFAGCHFREIERKSMLSTGLVRYHLTYLTKHGLITEERDENHVRYFPEQFANENKKILGFLRQVKIREIILILLTQPLCNNEQIAKAIQVSPSTASWHLKKLEEREVITSVKKGRSICYTLVDTENIIRLLITYRESFVDALVDRTIEMWKSV